MIANRTSSSLGAQLRVVRAFAARGFSPRPQVGAFSFRG